MEAHDLSASAAAALMAAGELSAEELTRSCLRRIEARDPVVKAWIHVDPDAAIRKAREADKIRLSKGARGPLHGLPFGVKDMIDTADLPTTNNSPAHAFDRPSHDAHCVQVAKGNGGFVLGKTDTVEFAAGGRKALTHHPMKPGHTPGGSSSGSAAAVADRQVPLAFGTQTAGSLIRPASFNGVYALKPTHGLVAWSGSRHYAPSLDTIGWYGRAVEDLSLVAKAFRLCDLDGNHLVPVDKLRIGIARTHNWKHAEPSGKDALERAARRLAEAGASVIDVELPEPFSRLNEAQHTILSGEGRVQFLAEYLTHYHELHPDFRDTVENVANATPERYLEAVNLAARCREIHDGLYGAGLDALLTLAAPGEAPEGLHTTGDWVMNAMWTVLHAPCVAIPGELGAGGLPVGVQLVGPRCGDAGLLKVATVVAPILDAAVDQTATAARAA